MKPLALFITGMIAYFILQSQPSVATDYIPVIVSQVLTVIVGILSATLVIALTIEHRLNKGEK